MNNATTTPVVVPDATAAPIAPAVSAVTPTKVINTVRAIAADDIPGHGAGSRGRRRPPRSRSEANSAPKKPESARREVGRFPRGALPLAGKVLLWRCPCYRRRQAFLNTSREFFFI